MFSGLSRKEGPCFRVEAVAVCLVSYTLASFAQMSSKGQSSLTNLSHTKNQFERYEGRPAEDGSVRRGRSVAIATWEFGKIATEAARPILNRGGHTLDALEAGINAVELDNKDQYFVGLGGLPNAEGQMEFDAAVMDGDSLTYGAVLAIRDVLTAFSAARLVLVRCPHSILVGDGATKFALENGIAPAKTLTDDAKMQYEEWMQRASSGSPAEKGYSHDTVGMICLDEDGRLSAGTSTSGWKFKHPGRVGDAPVVGSGLYCDGKAGAAVATGDGEEILRICLSFLVVQYMRAGDSPRLACRKGIARIIEVCNRKCRESNQHGRDANFQSKMHDKLTVAVMAMSPTGEVGAASTLGPHNQHRGRSAFPFAICRGGEQVRVLEETDQSD